MKQNKYLLSFYPNIIRTYVDSNFFTLVYNMKQKLNAGKTYLFYIALKIVHLSSTGLIF